jgi:hypothetical protein
VFFYFSPFGESAFPNFFHLSKPTSSLEIEGFALIHTPPVKPAPVPRNKRLSPFFVGKKTGLKKRRLFFPLTAGKY